MNPWPVITLVVAALLGWGLSGFDTKVTGVDKVEDFVRRAARNAISLLLVAGLLFGGLLWLPLGLLLALVWMTCVAEMFTGGFHKLVDSSDDREVDPQRIYRDLDKLAALVKDGRNDEAIAFCRHLEESGEASALAIETVLFRLYSEKYSDDCVPTHPELADIQRRCRQSQFSEAEARLQPLVSKSPVNLDAAFMLARTYARDLKVPEKASALVDRISTQPHIPPGFIEYTRRCLKEWSGFSPRKEKTSEGIESLLIDRKPAPASPIAAVLKTGEASVDELLSAGHLATAIERLEKLIDEQPDNFELRLKLAQAHARCGDLAKAGKLIDKLRRIPAFSPDQIQQADAKLKEWRAKL